VLDRVGRLMRGISRRLIASYVLVAIAAVVLAEVFVLGYLGPRLVNDATVQAQVEATAGSYWALLSQRYPNGIPAGTLLGDRGLPSDPGSTVTAPDGTLAVPAVPGAIGGRGAVTAVVAIARDGTVIASSIPDLYRPGRLASPALPAKASAAIDMGLLKGTGGSAAATSRGSVYWTLFGGAGGPVPSRNLAFLYVQAPQSTGFVNPIGGWQQLGRVAGRGPLDATLLLLGIIPIGALCGLLASRRLVRRLRRLERAAIAAAEGDYSLALPSSDRDEVGRLESNVATMARQLRSALAAERERATIQARAAERSRIAREIHDAISQHLFGLRMIASGMRRADPHNEQAHAIERITQEALRDMQALLWELRPPGLDGVGLTPALHQVCAAYRDRLGVAVDTDLAAVTLPEPVEDALLRVTQEACTNAVRHGGAHRLAVSMNRWDGHVELAVRDNGTGFDPFAAHSGSGLRHIRDRVVELGGTVDIESAPGVGAAVTVRVPVP
jgi:signal transduction histidine kinase